MKSEQVVRHPLTVRLTHWAVALSGIALLFSGLGQLPMYKRYNVIKIPGLGWSGDFEITLLIHYLASVVFVAAVFFHLVYHLWRKEFACMPKRGDFKESIQMLKAMVTKKQPPPHDKFLAEQRLAYLAIGIVSLLLIATGLIKTYKNTGPVVLNPTFLEVVTLTHTLSAMLFLLLLVTHIAAFVLKANRPLLISMLTGRVSRDYANQRHPKWKVDPQAAPSIAAKSPQSPQDVVPLPEARR